MPNHLFFGDKLNGNSDGLDAVIKITSRYTDLVNFQYYDILKIILVKCSRGLKKFQLTTLINGDSVTLPRNNAKPFGPHCKSKEAK